MARRGGKKETEEQDDDMAADMEFPDPDSEVEAMDAGESADQDDIDDDEPLSDEQRADVAKLAANRLLPTSSPGVGDAATTDPEADIDDDDDGIPDFAPGSGGTLIGHFRDDQGNRIRRLDTPEPGQKVLFRQGVMMVDADGNDVRKATREEMSRGKR